MAFLNKLEESLIAGLLALMAIVTCLQVALRYIFNSGVLWGMEVTTYAFVWMVLLGISYGIRTNSHIAVDLLVGKLPNGMRRIVVLVSGMLCLFYAAAMFWGSYLYVERLAFLNVDAQDIAIPKWLISVILPIGFGLLFFRLVQVMLAIFKGDRTFLSEESEQPSIRDKIDRQHEKKGL